MCDKLLFHISNRFQRKRLLVTCFIACSLQMNITWFDFGLKVPHPAIIPVSERRVFFLGSHVHDFLFWVWKGRRVFYRIVGVFFIYLFQRTLFHYITSQRSSLSVKHSYCNPFYVLGSIIFTTAGNCAAGECLSRRKLFFLQF